MLKSVKSVLKVPSEHYAKCKNCHKFKDFRLGYWNKKLGVASYECPQCGKRIYIAAPIE